MRIALIAPPVGGARGNRTTHQRWSEALSVLGHTILSIQPEQTAEIRNADIVHGHQAVHTGLATLSLAKRLGVPAVISLGGTDIHGGKNATPSPEVCDNLSKSNGVIVPHQAQGLLVLDHVPTPPPIHVVPRGIACPDTLPRPCTARGLRVLMVGAIRPVKGQLAVMELLGGISDLPEGFTLVICGPVADSHYWEQVERLAGELGYVEIMNPVPPAQMPDVYKNAHALLNHSAHEGASNAILEAWAAGRSVAATNVPGNRELLEGAPATVATLLLPGDRNALRDWIGSLMENLPAKGTAADSISSAAHAHLAENHSLQGETEALLGAYHKTLQGW